MEEIEEKSLDIGDSGDESALSTLQDMEKSATTETGPSSLQGTNFWNFVTASGSQRYGFSSSLFYPPDTGTNGCTEVGGAPVDHKVGVSCTHSWEARPPRFGKVHMPFEACVLHGFPSVLTTSGTEPQPRQGSYLFTFCICFHWHPLLQGAIIMPMLIYWAICLLGLYTYPLLSTKRSREEETGTGLSAQQEALIPKAKKAKGNPFPTFTGEEGHPQSPRGTKGTGSSGCIDLTAKGSNFEDANPFPLTGSNNPGAQKEMGIAQPLLPSIPDAEVPTLEPIPSREETWTIKIVSHLETAELKKRIHAVLLPTAKDTGYHIGLLNSLILVDRVSNVWHWSFPKGAATNNTVSRIFRTPALWSPVANTMGIFIMNAISAKQVVAGEVMAEASAERYHRQPLLMTGPLSKEALDALPRWLASLKEPGRDLRAHPRAAIVGIAEGPSRMTWALLETYSPDTFAWFAEGNNEGFQAPGAPPKFTGVPWCSAPNSVVLHSVGFNGVKRENLQAWVEGVAEALKAPVPVGVVGLTSPQTGNALNGLRLIFSSAANKVPWAPATDKLLGSGQVERALALTNPYPTTVYERWGEPPAKDGQVVVKSAYPHVRGEKKAPKSQPIDVFTSPKGPQHPPRKRGVKKKKGGKPQSKAANMKNGDRRAKEKEKKSGTAKTDPPTNPTKPKKGGAGHKASK